MDNKFPDIRQEELEKLAEIIQKESGIYLDLVKLKRFKRRIQTLLFENGFQNFSAFYHQVRFAYNRTLIEKLINTVSTNETYFWRESAQFDILTTKILPKFIIAGMLKKVRILVAPCSSGEEVYSIMLAILNTNDLIDKLHIEMVGIDIDSMMIEKAKKGIFTKRSVEKLPKELLKKYFTQMGGMYKIDKSLRDAATFLHHNIFDANSVKKLGKFDIVFSRNMLIYFNDTDKQKAYTQFSSFLQPKGYLLLGHADANKIDKELFYPISRASHIYQKR